MDMNDSTVNIADFRGIREIKRRNAHNTPRSTKSNFGFLVLETPSVYCAREPESWNGSAQSASPAVVDIGELREARRFGHRFSIESHVSQRGANGVIAFFASCAKASRGKPLQDVPDLAGAKISRK